MKFQALIFDLDGTAVELRESALPSKRLVRAVGSAKKLMKVSVATGRPITNCREILRDLDITDPCVISGGSQIINPKTEQVLWEKKLDLNQVKIVLEALINLYCKVLFSDELLDDDIEMDPNKKIAEHAENVIYAMEMEENDVDSVVKKLDKIPNIAVHPMPSWREGKKDVHITHQMATKRHALEKLLSIINVSKEHVVSVGDSGNDIPLFEVSGYKVAMGNATDELKKAADTVVESVLNDGLAKFIESRLL